MSVKNQNRATREREITLHSINQMKEKKFDIYLNKKRDDRITNTKQQLYINRN